MHGHGFHHLDRVADNAQRLENPDSRSIQRLALAICCGLYTEIVLGAQFRHPLPDVSTVLSLVLLWIKVNIAAFLVAGMVYLLVLVLRHLRQAPLLVRRVKLLAAFTSCNSLWPRALG